MSVIILEGPDCAGKTTLAQHVVDLLRRMYPHDEVTYHHAGPPTEHPLDEYVAPLLDYRPGVGRHVVCDRWHVGEYVYPVVLNRRTRLTPAVRWYLEAFLRSRGALLVYCTSSIQHLRECGTYRDDDPTTVSLVPATVAAFDRAVAASLLPGWLVDATIPVITHHETLAREVVARATHEAARVEDLNPFTTYVGPARPQLLLVGDRRGVRGDPAEHGHWPAFVPRLGTSGDYLLTTLASAEPRVPTHGLTLGDVGLVNANDVDDVRACWEALGRPETVGLGVNARRTLRAAHVPHRSAVHPQYHRRFLHHSRHTYLRQLLNHDHAAVTA